MRVVARGMSDHFLLETIVKISSGIRKEELIYGKQNGKEGKRSVFKVTMVI